MSFRTARPSRAPRTAGVRETARMRRERAALVAALLGAATLAGCVGGWNGANLRRSEPLPPVDRAAASAASLANHLAMLQRLIQGAPAEQAEILASVKQAYDTAPTPSHVLEYALVLATPGHPGFNAPHAELLLREALATPETLLPSERAMAVVTMRTTERQLALVAENRRLESDSDADHDARARTGELSRHLDMASAENARLRKELEEARTKLDAIANIERSLNARKGRTQGSTQ
ncbi:MAG: hypothetical protein ACREUG_04035, partial [Steroidobacteraceae bacterium]